MNQAHLFKKRPKVSMPELLSNNCVIGRTKENFMRKKNILLCLVLFTQLPLVLYSQGTISKKDSAVIMPVLKKDSLQADSVKAQKESEIQPQTVIHKDTEKDIQFALNNPMDSISIEKATIGLGLGLDFGGIGANVTVYPQKNIGLFLGGGYALAKYGFNAGVKFRYIVHDDTAQPFIAAMYGYNTAIVVDNALGFNKLFYNFSFGFGFDIKSKSNPLNSWSLAIFVPIRDAEVDDYMKDLEDNHNIEFKNKLWPVAISIGYKFGIK
jgi:hypothetical protein